MLIALLVSCRWLEPSGSALPPPVTVAPTVHTRTVVSQPYHIDRLYASMRGPHGFDDVWLHEGDGVELLWIVGYRTTVIDGDSLGALSQEFMCHANLDFDTAAYYERFPSAPPLSGRVFTLSQGQQEIRFPDGMGIPITSDLPLTLATQVLNLTTPDADLRVRHQVEVMFVRDTEVTGRMVPLFQGAVEGFKALGQARFYGFSDDEIDHGTMGPGCGVGQAAMAGDSDDDGLGQAFTAHWVVPPGREVNHTNVTRFLNLQFDTTVHYIAVHLHPFAESLALRDLTTDQTVYEARVTPRAGQVGIERVDHYASPRGLPLRKAHQYELVSVYDNTSDHEVDSMAVMYLYMRDHRFVRPDPHARNAAERTSADPGTAPSGTEERGPSM